LDWGIKTQAILSHLKGGVYLAEDFWSRWFKKRRRPFVNGWIFGDIDDSFNEIEKFIAREFQELFRKNPKEQTKKRALPGSVKIKRRGPFVYGYIVTIGPNGRPVIRKFGNFEPGKKLGKNYLDIKDKREPLADILTINEEIHVVVELPGVAKKDINLRGTQESIIVSVNTAKHKYYKKLELPAKVDPKTANSSYNNGVLEIVFKKKSNDSKPEHLQID
jgi:HSP20 family protein